MGISIDGPKIHRINDIQVGYYRIKAENDTVHRTTNVVSGLVRDHVEVEVIELYLEQLYRLQHQHTTINDYKSHIAAKRFLIVLVMLGYEV